MTSIRSKLLLLSACAALLLPAIAFGAGIFSDVSDAHPHKGPIESLARSGIVKGNPDGKYYPERSVNRAELLTLLYRATNRTAAAPTGPCYSDVERGSWYEAVVCDATKNAFVQGYSDGRFRPASPVTRTEALKMIHTVFGFEVPDVTEKDRDLVKFVDVSVAAWYTKYIVRGYALGILPIAGESGSRFYPDKELLRGEAAAYMWNALNAKVTMSSSASSASSQASVQSEDDIRQVPFPFSDSGVFDGKKPIGYVFTLTGQKTVVHTTVTIVGFYSSDVTCRLYKLNEGGFSGEYYLGIQTTNSCMIKAAVPAGNYQIQIQPALADVSYVVEAKTAETDGNDGFMDALSLSPTVSRTAAIEANDIYDWYSFSVAEKMMGTISVAGTTTLNCIIYTPLTVDQLGFVGPECNTPYEYQPDAVYMVGVGRHGASDIAKKQTYTVKWQ